MESPLGMIGFDPAFSFTCALFAPPFLLFTVIAVYALDRHDYQLWKLKIGLYQSARRLFLHYDPALDRHDDVPVAITVHTAGDTTTVNDSVTVDVKAASALLPRHRLASEPQQPAPVPVTQPTQPQPVPTNEPRDSLQNAKQRLSVSFFLSLSMLLSLIAPPLFLASWCAALFVQGYTQTAIALFCSSVAVLSVVIALCKWHRQQWYLTSAIRVLLTVSVSMLLSLTLMLTFTSPVNSPLSFFARSVHFLVIHMLCMTEISVISETEEFVTVAPLISLEQRNDREERIAERNEAKRKARVRRTRAKALLGLDSTDSDSDSGSDSDSDSDSSDSDSDAETDPRSKLTELPSHAQSFHSHVAHRSLTQRFEHREAYRSQLLILRVVGYGALVAYAIATYYYYDDPMINTDPNDRSFDPRFMGLLIGLAVIVFDTTLSMLKSTLTALAISQAKILTVMCITRAVLIGCDENTWFVSFAALYLMYGGLIVYTMIDTLLPFHSLTKRTDRQRTVGQRYQRLTIGELRRARPEPQWSQWAEPLMASMKQHSPVTVPVICAIALTVLFLMAMVISYITAPPAIVIDIGLTQRVIHPYVLGFLSLFLTLTLSLTFLTYRTLFFHHFGFTKHTVLTCLLTQLFFTATGLYCYYESESLLFLCLFVLCPLLCLSMLYSYACHVTLGQHATVTVKLALSGVVTVAMIALLGFSISVWSVTIIGWSLVCVLVVLVASLIPAIKYANTLTLQSHDELLILVSIVTLAVYIYLLETQLSLERLQSFVLYSASVGYVILVMAVMGAIDYHTRRILTSWTAFVLSALVVYILSVGGISFLFFDRVTSACIVGVTLLVVMLIALLLYIAAHQCRVSGLAWAAIIAVVAVIVTCGVVGAMYVYQHYTLTLSFIAFSFAYYTLIVAILASSFILQYIHSNSSSHLLHYAPSVLPVHSLDLLRNRMSVYHRHVYVFISAFVLLYAWCIAAILVGFESLGIGASVSFLLVMYLNLRSMSLSAMRSLSSLVPYIDESMLRAIHSEVWQCYSYGHEGDDVGTAVVDSIQRGNGKATQRRWRKAVTAKQQELGLTSASSMILMFYHLFFAKPSVSHLDMDSLFDAIIAQSAQLTVLSELLYSVESHTYFLLMMRGEARRREEQAKFAIFVTWLNKHRPELPVELDAQVSEIIALNSKERRDLLLSVDEWELERLKQSELNAQNRIVEKKGQQRREEIIKRRIEEASDTDEADSESDEQEGGDESTQPVDPSDPYGHLSASAVRSSTAPLRSRTGGQPRSTVASKRTPVKSSVKSKSKPKATIAKKPSKTKKIVNEEADRALVEPKPKKRAVSVREQAREPSEAKASNDTFEDDPFLVKHADEENEPDDEEKRIQRSPRLLQPMADEADGWEAELVQTVAALNDEESKEEAIVSVVSDDSAEPAQPTTEEIKQQLADAAAEQSIEEQSRDVAEVDQQPQPAAIVENEEKSQLSSTSSPPRPAVSSPAFSLASPPALVPLPDDVDLDNPPLIIEDHQLAHSIFTAIQTRFAQTGQKWTDQSFPAAPQSLYITGERDSSRGSAVHATSVESWKRPEEIIKTMKENGYDIGPEASYDVSVSVAADGFQCSDVVQGNIGTCYLLSALGVMAAHEQRYPTEKLLSESIPMLTSLSYHASGCYIIKFHRQHRTFFLLIDDLLPCQANGLPSFSHCRAYSEIWVALLEKAYAKLSGCYESIEAGYIHQALADLTNGNCQEIALHDDSGNVNVNSEMVWARLQQAYASGVMLGCGSNSGSNNDNVNGIVQGHAYAIKRVFSDSAVKLVQLFNPWGHSEWTGDWADDSEKWTPYYINKLDYVKADDGAFWMEFSDFLLMYENVYLCRLVPHCVSLPGHWSNSDGSAAGPRAPTKNPHYVFTVAKPQTIAIELEQSYLSKAMIEREGRQYAYIQFYIVTNGGQRVSKLARKEIKGWANDGKLVNTRTVSAEFVIDSDGVGVVHTLMCCTSDAGVETAFTLSLFTAEPIECRVLP